MRWGLITRRGRRRRIGGSCVCLGDGCVHWGMGGRCCAPDVLVRSRPWRRRIRVVALARALRRTLMGGGQSRGHRTSSKEKAHHTFHTAGAGATGSPKQCLGIMSQTRPLTQERSDWSDVAGQKRGKGGETDTIPSPSPSPIPIRPLHTSPPFEVPSPRHNHVPRANPVPASPGVGIRSAWPFVSRSYPADEVASRPWKGGREGAGLGVTGGEWMVWLFQPGARGHLSSGRAARVCRDDGRGCRSRSDLDRGPGGCQSCVVGICRVGERARERWAREKEWARDGVGVHGMGVVIKLSHFRRPLLERKGKR